MHIYKVAIGHGVALLSLNDIIQQPTGDPIAPAERGFGASNVVHHQGRFVRLHFDHFNTPEEYMDVLEQFGLDNALDSEVTVYVRDERLQSVRCNGTAYLPEPGVDIKWNNFFPRDVDIYVVDLENL